MPASGEGVEVLQDGDWELSIPVASGSSQIEVERGPVG
jgi:hypothetical protein